jgi:hypothetical protein
MATKKAGVPKQPKPARRVRVKLGDGNADFQGKTNIQKGLRATAPQSPKFTPAVKVTLDTWSASTDKAVVLYDDIIKQEAALEQSYGTLGTVLLQVGLDRDAFINAVQNVCTSTADAKSFGADAIGGGKHVEPAAPVEIRQIQTDLQGANKIRWPSEPGAASYMAEASADPPTASSWTGCHTGMSPFFVYAGAPGQKVWFRICSIGKAPSAWSTPFLVILR